MKAKPSGCPILCDFQKIGIGAADITQKLYYFAVNLRAKRNQNLRGLELRLPPFPKPGKGWGSLSWSEGEKSQTKVGQHPTRPIISVDLLLESIRIFVQQLDLPNTVSRRLHSPPLAKLKHPKKRFCSVLESLMLELSIPQY